jgi:hypothetical protein
MVFLSRHGVLFLRKQSNLLSFVRNVFGQYSTQGRLFGWAKRDLACLGQGQPHSGNAGSLGAEKLAHPAFFSTLKQAHHGLLLTSTYSVCGGFAGVSFTALAVIERL